MLVITKIEPAGPGRRACRLRFADAQTQDQVIPGAVARKLSLEEGSSLSSLKELRARVDEAEGVCAMERCLRLLNARDKTSHELRRRLAQDGYHGKAIDATLKQLSEHALIDDERFTGNYVENSLRAKKGWSRIVRELKRKGIEIDVDDERWRPDEEVEYEAACALIERLPLSTEKERERALRRLITRGYAYPMARRVLTAHKAMLYNR